MKKISVSNLPVRAYINEPVYLDEKYILMTPDTPVTNTLVKRLEKWKYKEVFSNGTPTTSPASLLDPQSSDQAMSLEQGLEDTEGMKAALAFYEETVTFLKRVFTRYQERNELLLDILTDRVKLMMDEVRAHKRHLLNMPQEAGDKSNYLAVHSVKTAILSLVLADFLKLPNHKQIDIGVAALLHKIGMLRIPPQLYLTDRVLSPKEKQALTAHPVLSYRILREKNFPPAVCLAVLEHQERIDGTGYPRQVTGEKISLFGKIISVASSYDAATSPRPYKEARDGHSGLMDLLKDIGKRYDEQIMKALVFTLSIYPIGTYVEMTDGSWGIVVKTAPENPKNPIVKILANSMGEIYLEPPISDTSTEGAHKIGRSLSKTEIENLKRNMNNRLEL